MSGLKVVLIILFCSLTFYAPMELSRLILWYELDFKFIFELCYIWITYLIALAIIAKLIKVW